jgi:hypothetical protein
MWNFFYIGLGAGLGLMIKQAHARPDFGNEDPAKLLAQIETWTGQAFIPTSLIDRSREERRKYVAKILRVSSLDPVPLDRMYHNVMMMRYHADPTSPGDLFIELPYLYLRKMNRMDPSKRDPLARCGSTQTQVAFHYTLFTRQLCRAYLLRNGHLWTYVQHLW